MTTTFGIHTTPADWRDATYVADCECPGAQVVTFANEDQAIAWALARNSAPEGRRERLVGCTDELCGEYDLHPRPQSAFFLEVNTDGHVLRLLGLSADPNGGTTGAPDFMGRVLLGEALLHHHTPGPRALVYRQNLALLRDLAEVARFVGRDITWG